MAGDGVDDALVHVQPAQELLRLDAVLLGPLLEIYVVEYAHRAPVVDVLRVARFGDFPEHLADGLGVLYMEGLGIIALDKLERLFGCGYIAHVDYLRC